MINGHPVDITLGYERYDKTTTSTTLDGFVPAAPFVTQEQYNAAKKLLDEQ